MLHLRDIMTPHVQTFSREMTIGAALKTLSTKRMSGAPVLSDEKVCGIISVADIVGVIAASPDPAAAQQKTVGEVMTGQIHSLPSRAPVRNAATLMREKHIHRVLIVDDGQIVGMVSALDVARAVSDVGVGNIHVIHPNEDDPSPWITA